MTPKMLIIGYGNPLRRDDGVGWQAAQYLSRELSGKGVEVIACHQLVPEHAERISQADLVIFIDASVGASPGSVSCTAVEPEVASPADLTHHVTPSVLMDCSRKLYNSNPKAYFLSVCGESFELGEGLSPAVSSALPEVVRKARQLASLSGLRDKAEDGSCDSMCARFPNTPLEKQRINEVARHGNRDPQPRKDRQG